MFSFLHQSNIYKALLVIKYWPAQVYSNECILHGKIEELELLKSAYEGGYIIPNTYPSLSLNLSIAISFFQTNPYVPTGIRFSLSDKGEKYLLNHSPFSHIWEKYKLALRKDGYSVG